MVPINKLCLYVFVLGCDCCATGHCWAVLVAVAETLSKYSCNAVTRAGLIKPEDDHYDYPKQSCSDLWSYTSDLTPLFKEEFYGFHPDIPEIRIILEHVCWHWLRKLFQTVLSFQQPFSFQCSSDDNFCIILWREIVTSAMRWWNHLLVDFFFMWFCPCTYVTYTSQ